MTRRDQILQLVATEKPQVGTPAAFFLHFPPEFRSGRAAVDKHVEYFRATGNDIMKIQYEKRFEPRDDIRTPADWSRMTCYGEEFYTDQLNVVKGVVNELKGEAVVILTLYSAFMFAGHVVGKETLDRHLEEDPDAVGRGLNIIAESMITLIGGCINRGVDGFYASTQGGEEGRFSDSSIFDSYIRPVEMRIWSEIDRRAELNILHVCDYAYPYRSLDRFVNYPGQIVSAPTHLIDRTLTGREISTAFGRPFLGGMERLGPLSKGTKEEVVREAEAALEVGGESMILGADCTLAADADWNNIAAATATAHRHRSGG
jgi:uroporphyrinogen decarboxylase